MSKIAIKEMFESAVHIGHRSRKWDPRMKKFLYGELEGIHVINLEKTAEYLENALKFLSKLASEGRTILFVSTKPQSKHLLIKAAEECGMPYVVSKWIPGLLTNFATIKMRTKYLADLKNEESTGEFSKYTKKEASKLKKVIDKLETSLGGVQSLADLPDAVFVLDVVKDQIAVEESKKLGIPVVGITDTNADPTSVDFPIPGNDDAVKSLEYFINKVGTAVKSARK